MKVNLVYDVTNFVLKQGNIIDKLRIAAADYNVPSELKDEILKYLKAIINEDGGVPFEVQPGVPSAVKTTAEVLTLLLKLNWGTPELIDMMVQFIVSRQKSDGGFAETLNLNSYIEDRYGATEGREWYPVGKSITWLTGKALEALCLAKYADDERLRRARDFLIYSQNEDGHWPDYKELDVSDPLGTGNILPALVAMEVGPGNKVYEGARAALYQHLKHAIEEKNLFDMVDLIAIAPPKNKHETQIFKDAIPLLLETQRNDGGWSGIGMKKSDPELSAYLAMVVAICGEYA